jgi:hypothetical protein
VLIQLAKPQQYAPPFNPLIGVHFEQPGSGSPNWSEAKDKRAVQLEMVRPSVTSRMEQERNFVRIRVKAGEICAFVQVALVAG